MEERILKKAAIFIMLMSIAACCAVPWFPYLRDAHAKMLASYKEYRTKSKAERLNMTGLELMEYNNKQEEASFESQIRLELPFGVSGSDLEVSEDLLTSITEIRIPFAGEDYFYEYPVLGSGEYIESLTYEKNGNYGVVKFVTDRVCEIRTDYDKEYFYIDFLTPKELYDRVVVIDAGYGGDAPGITKQGIYEKDINLDILLKLKEIFEASSDSSVGVYYTRTTDVNPSEKERVGLSNRADADLFISIHSNSTQSGRMSSINGTQVFYSDRDGEEEKNSREFSQICLEEITAAAQSSDKGLVLTENAYVIQNSNAPAALIEVGFMTNQKELENLCSSEYQSKIAKGIYNAIARAFAEGY